MASRILLRTLKSSLCQSKYAARSSQNLQKKVVPSVASFHSSVVSHNQHIINIQDEQDFQNRVLKSETPVIVDFHATWCGPCKILGPRLESLIVAQKGKVIMAKVDIDDHSDLAIDHGVQAVPTVVAIKQGKVVDKFVGLKDDTELDSFIKKAAGN